MVETREVELVCCIMSSDLRQKITRIDALWEGQGQHKLDTSQVQPWGELESPDVSREGVKEPQNTSSYVFFLLISMGTPKY